jgi:hypothetical protein
MARFEQQVDPDGLLTPAERQRRAEAARRAYFAGLAFRSALARSKGLKKLRLSHSQMSAEVEGSDDGSSLADPASV